MLDKETFVKYMWQIDKGYKQRNSFSDAIEILTKDTFMCSLGEDWLDVALNLLEFIMHDDDEYPLIERWLYEEYALSTPEMIYDELVDRMNRKDVK